MSQKVTVSIPRLEVSGGAEKRKEIYVAGVVAQESDWRDQVDGASQLCRREKLRLQSSVEPVGATSGQAPSRNTNALLFRSETFHRVRYGLSMSGSGLLLYPPANPGEWFSLYIAVMESDEGLRTLGGVVAELTKQAKGDNELQARMTSEPVLVFGACPELWSNFVYGRLIIRRRSCSDRRPRGVRCRQRNGHRGSLWRPCRSLAGAASGLGRRFRA